MYVYVRQGFRALIDNLVVRAADEVQKRSETGWARGNTVYIDHKSFGLGERELGLCLDEGEEEELGK